MSEPEVLAARWLGRRGFAEVLDLQIAARDALSQGTTGPTLFLVEHPPTVTLGRRGRPSDVLWDEAHLRERGVEVCETPRGGEATLHAPGQLVVYPVVRVGRRIREHIQNLAESTIALLHELEITSHYRPEHPGVWLADGRKIASIGIHVSRGITVQGLALNVEVATDLFGALVSCGLPDVQMASIAQLRAEPPPPLDVLARRWADEFARRAGFLCRFEADDAGST